MQGKIQKKLFQDISKINYSLSRFLNNIDKPNILEFGVQLGSSTKYFLDLCEEKNGKLYSVDIDDCSKLFNNNNWKFIQSRDDSFDYISSKIPKQLDIIYLDTIHTAKHVEKIFKHYYKYLNKNGFFIVDDISWLPYLKSNYFNNFFCEINNKETFDKILSIYNENLKNFELSFSFKGTGTAIIEKLNNNELNDYKNIKTRETSLKNFLRNLLRKDG
tara:strand:- start:422 stop:1072 length:651 start_codon:yes stop_codon:yes gene_type:complete